MLFYFTIEATKLLKVKYIGQALDLRYLTSSKRSFYSIRLLDMGNEFILKLVQCILRNQHDTEVSAELSDA